MIKTGQQYSFVRDGKFITIVVEDTDLPNNDNRSLSDIYYRELGISDTPLNITKLIDKFYIEMENENLEAGKKIFEEVKLLDITESTLIGMETSIFCMEILNED